ncbi:hypothetical protein GOV05_02315 [Candidatus Woesearchaeota archaeon]|nr:hypothetical protein [Candidatus Woesearchaeota archaeon]
MELVSKQEVLDAVRRDGPLIPRDIVRTLQKSDTFMVGAVLSELVDQKSVKVSNTKIGGSPAYYVGGQEERLVSLSKYLNEKDKRAYDLLEEKKVVKDSELEPLMRVAIRAIKDFSRPLEVNLKGEKTIFWKWYALKNDEAANLIRDLLGVRKEEKEEKVVEVQKPKEEVRTDFHFKKNDEQTPLVKEEEVVREDFDATSFYGRIRNFFSQNNIQILEEETLRKQKEYDFVISVPSAFGSLTYFCKAKDKKRNNEQDAAAAYLVADQKRLPTIYLTSGEFTKKAVGELEKYKNITTKKI